MIDRYYRPNTLSEAIALLSDAAQPAIPLGGGAVVSKMRSFSGAVVDLQNLGLDYLLAEGEIIRLGASLRLQPMLLNDAISKELGDAVDHECSYNLRQQATIAGTLITADGRSPLGLSFLALNAQLTWQPDDALMAYADYLAGASKKGVLISEVRFQKPNHFVFENVGRAPYDRPVAQAALAAWADGAERLSIGGWGKAPLLAWSGPRPDNWRAIIQSKANISDQWAGGEYRSEAMISVVQSLFDRVQAEVL
jgi:CO/xanthine dehydrogenase FAD-binding subunit